MAYQSDLDGDQDIFVFNALTGATRKLTENTVNDYAPSFRCDSSGVLFNSDVSGNADIYEADALPLDAAPIDVVARHLGYSAASNGTAATMLASLRYFGLLGLAMAGVIAGLLTNYWWVPLQMLKVDGWLHSSRRSSLQNHSGSP